MPLKDAQVLQYCRQKCLGLNMSDTQKRVLKRFPSVSKARWHRLEPAIVRLLAAQDDTSPSVETISYPPHEPPLVLPDDMTPAAKAAMAQLMAVNCQSECRAQTLQVANQVLKDQMGRSESRVRVLKSMLKVVLDAME